MSKRIPFGSHIKSPKKCPLCDSENTTSSIAVGTYKIGASHEFYHEEKVVQCNDCESSFSYMDEKEFWNRHRIQQRIYMTKVLEKLAEKGIKEPYIERVFGLRQGAMSKYTTRGEYTDADVALLHILEVYPEILEKLD